MRQKRAYPSCFTNFGTSPPDIAETWSKLTSKLRCVQYKRGVSALLQRRSRKNSGKHRTKVRKATAIHPAVFLAFGVQNLSGVRDASIVGTRIHSRNLPNVFEFQLLRPDFTFPDETHAIPPQSCCENSNYF